LSNPAPKTATPPAARPAGATAPLRLLLYALVGCNAVMAVAVIAAARLFSRPSLYLTATAPLLLVGVLGLTIWWETRRPPRATLYRVIGWATVAFDAVLLAHAAITVHLAGRFGLALMTGPVALGALLSGVVWWGTHSAPSSLSSGSTAPNGTRRISE
jgi:hypothetical protein